MALAATAGGGAAMITEYDVATIQRGLKARGHDPGVVDGVWGPNTERAIREFQAVSGLEVTGRPSAELQSRLTTN
jgi:peptidoglycan hydrolase-like protein with peptidoglycan-binding domain